MINCISLESTIRILCFIKNLEPEFAFKSPVLSMAVIMSVVVGSLFIVAPIVCESLRLVLVLLCST